MDTFKKLFILLIGLLLISNCILISNGDDSHGMADYDADRDYIVGSNKNTNTGKSNMVSYGNTDTHQSNLVPFGNSDSGSSSQSGTDYDADRDYTVGSSGNTNTGKSNMVSYGNTDTDQSNLVPFGKSDSGSSSQSGTDYDADRDYTVGSSGNTNTGKSNMVSYGNTDTDQSNLVPFGNSDSGSSSQSSTDYDADRDYTVGSSRNKNTRQSNMLSDTDQSNLVPFGNSDSGSSSQSGTDYDADRDYVVRGNGGDEEEEGEEDYGHQSNLVSFNDIPSQSHMVPYDSNNVGSMDAGTQTSQDMSQVENEISELSSELRNLESEVSQLNRQGSQPSSAELQTMENEIMKAENKLAHVQSEIEAIQASESSLGNSGIPSNEIVLEGRLLTEMRRIEEELHNMRMMGHVTVDTGNTGQNDYDADSDYVPGSGSNDNPGHSFNIPSPQADDNTNSAVIESDIYEADIDYIPAGQSDGVDLLAFQTQLHENTYTGQIIGIVFGSLLALIVVLSVAFGCIINAILWVKRRRSGSKAESTLLTSK